jgi:hypothetical protein
MNSWIHEEKYMKTRKMKLHEKYEVEYLLDETYTKIDNVPGLKTSLYPHQKTVIKAMIDLEMNRELDIQEYKSNKSNNEVYNLKISAGVLSEAVGSGKTIDILSVILLQKHPLIYPDISELNLSSSGTKYGNFTFSNCIRKKLYYKLKPNIIFVGVGVVNQWINAIKKFTSLKYFVVVDVKCLQQLINCMYDNSINCYDIIIVKNGRVSRPIIFPPNIIIENKNLHNSNIPIYNIIANMRKFCWCRVIIDDFDTIKLPYNAGIVNGLFTWYISSTKKNVVKKYIYNNQFKKTSEMIVYSNYNCSNIMNNRILFYNLNIKNNNDFVSKTSNINSVKFYSYIFDNPNNQYMGFLSVMGDSAHEIMEMLNSDAIETAAEKIGIKTDKIADIFQHVLGNQYKLYKKSVDVLDFIESQSNRNRIHMSQNPDPDDTYKKSDLFIQREIKYNYNNIKSLLESTKDEYMEIKKKTGISLERVKNNIKDGECPICCSDLCDEEEIIIIKCCGVIVCGLCCFSTIFKKLSSGQCSNCRSELNLHDLIYLNKNFDLNRIIDEHHDEEQIETKCEEKNEIETPITKISCIIDIINGEKIDTRKRIDVNIPNLMKGTNILPEVSYNKVLIFANYDETIKKIVLSLTTDKIKFWSLCGSYKAINKTQELFNACNEPCALVINSLNHCAGLNLQTATDIIFIHKIIDRDIETQVIGRGQRLGRTSTLNVHYMLYENEYNWMTNSNSICEINDN